ncbi:MAG TPA: phytanoyl-CoA dioxygenase family protein [Armatimonadota bacterium]|nr:phytanoyl-CoA dioxygenase family protein [Armatimonadota bacterium]
MNENDRAATGPRRSLAPYGGPIFRRGAGRAISTIRPGVPLEDALMQGIIDQFHQDGFALVKGVLDLSEIAALRTAIDDIFADPAAMERHRHGFPFVAARLWTGPEIFGAMAQREPIYSLVAAILGPGHEIVGMNAIRNGPGVAISRWHVDDVLEFPLPESVPRHDPRIQMPVLWLSVQIALSDIEELEYGPGQFVPGSHYAGHHPPEGDNPVFEGREPVSVLCRAGDLYLQNHQCWHRGAPNESNRTRYILQQQYGSRWAVRRFTGIA